MMRIHYNENEMNLDLLAGRERNVGDMVTLVYVNDLNMNGRKPWYELHDARGAEYNQAAGKRTYHGWTGTTNGLFRFAKGLFRIEKIEPCKNGSEWIWLNEVSVEDDV